MFRLEMNRRPIVRGIVRVVIVIVVASWCCWLPYVDDDRSILDGDDTDIPAADAVATLKLREELHRRERQALVTFVPTVGPMGINNDDLNDRTVIGLTRNFIVRRPTAASCCFFFVGTFGLSVTR
jgi:hypothetical protein